MSATHKGKCLIDLTLDSDVEIEEEYYEIRDDTLRPPPPNPSNPNEYRVERIIDTKLTGAGRVYLIKWFGYPVEESTWRSERMMNCDEAVQHFWSTRKH